MPKDSGADSAGPSALEAAEAGVLELVDLEDYYFNADKGDKKDAAIQAVIESADRALAGKPASASQARAFCCKGRALAFLEGQERQAEEMLSKALKLNPQLAEAWNALGEVYWNQQNYAQAKSSFEQALELCGPHAVGLRNLSMVLRAVDGEEIEKAANYANGLKYAKEATVLDANDPQNWETLGNAYMGEFFVNGKRAEELNKALIAYNRAESAYEKLGKRNPTMHMNRGSAAKFLEDYSLAVQSFQTAAEIGAARGKEELDKIVELVKRLASQVDKKSDLKSKHLKELTSNMPQAAGATLQDLRSRGKEITLVGAKVISVIDRDSEIPVMLTCCDSAGAFFVLSIYNAESTKIAEAVTPLQTTLSIAKPHFKQISVNVGTELAYPSIRVAHPGDVTVVGGQNLSTAAVKPAFTSQRAPA